MFTGVSGGVLLNSQRAWASRNQFVGSDACLVVNAENRVATPLHEDRAILPQHLGVENRTWCRGFSGVDPNHSHHMKVLFAGDQVLVGEIDHQAGNELDLQKGFIPPDLATSFASRASLNESPWLLGSVGSKIERSFALWRVPSLPSSDAQTSASPLW